ncbi:beta-N-acetylhexosaminidase [Nibricoccus sp. IMCC34717]|uniref:beta-N-acetylhexosaminidase n=1 Tax=Nibricoccus sp. IMCC34717 TaxID=3034021 RepID=UPI00384DBF4C
MSQIPSRRRFITQSMLAASGALLATAAPGAEPEKPVTAPKTNEGAGPNPPGREVSPRLDLLVPQPSKIRVGSGAFVLQGPVAIHVPPAQLVSLELPLAQLGDAVALATGARPFVEAGALGRDSAAIRLEVSTSLGAESYELGIGGGDIRLRAATPAGFYYGVQTLRQLLALHGAALPCIEISDTPVYQARGFYHDVTRGKVPTLETLFALIEECAHLKLNQLQLYIEHTFVFRRHPDLSPGADGLTSEDILALDAYARRHHIELVPSMASFGHLYTLLAAPLKADLGEIAEDFSRWPFSWWDRMLKGTLNPLDPRVPALLRELFDEFLPLFSSKRFNLCGDETFDLGKGRNEAAAKERGAGRLYVDFVKQLCGIVAANGKTVMMWADIIGHHPELIEELPKDVVFLDWDYDPGLPNQRLKLLRNQSRPFYVCPGVQAWRGFLGHTANAWLNIPDFARRGAEAGATGLLNTNWGDCGHVAGWAAASFGFWLGAAAAWNPAKTSERGEATFGNAWSLWALGDASGAAAPLVREAGLCQSVDWWTLMFFQVKSNSVPEAWYQPPVNGVRLPDAILKLDSSAWAKQHRRLLEIAAELRVLAATSRCVDPIAWRELAAGCEANALSIATAAVIHRAGGKPVGGLDPDAVAVAAGWRRLEPVLGELWHARNRPSEFFRLKLAILEIAANLERLGKPAIKA